MKQGDEIDAKNGKKSSYAFSSQFKIKTNLVLSYIYGLYEDKNFLSLQLYFWDLLLEHLASLREILRASCIGEEPEQLIFVQEARDWIAIQFRCQTIPKLG